ncbi:MAG: sensor histidine kinase [Bacteroidetes bacterium]|nr:sensor histidine kinase [Bacteroidota bacterium]
MRFLFHCIFLVLFTSLITAQTCDTSQVRQWADQSHRALASDLKESQRLAMKAYNQLKDCPHSPAYYEAVLALARVYHQKDLGDSALALIAPALQSLAANAPPYYKATLNHEMSVACIMLVKLGDGVKYGLESLRWYEKMKDSTNIANMMVNVANAYQQQNNFNQADKYLRQAEGIAANNSNKTSLGHVYNTMGILYAEHDQLDSSLSFFLRSTAIREKLGDHTSIVWNYNNLGGLYVMMGQPRKAVEYLEKALKAFETLGNLDGQSSVANNLGELYIELKDYKKAFEYFSYSRHLYEQTNDPDNLVSLYANLSAYYKLTNDPKTALQYSDSLVFLKDSLYGRRLDERMAEMQTKFDVEKKDLEIARHKADLEVETEKGYIKTIVIMAVLALLVLLSISAYLFYRKKQVQQKAELDAEIGRQKEARTRAVIDAEEKERRRIAQDLHDGVGQLLSAAKLNLSNLESKVKPATPEEQDALHNAISLVDDSVKEVRTVSHNMMPNTLIKMGLASAVREFIGKLGNQPSLRVDLEIVGLDERLEPQLETVLYRVIQEVVNNIIKHAKASQISMQLIRHDKELSFMIEDNGIGFDTSKLETFEGIGLKGIQSRIEFLNGSVHFDSQPGRGTTVIVEVPLH